MNFQPSDFEAVACDLCGKDTPIKRYEKRGFNIVECSNCHMVYTNPRLKGEKIGELYDADYFQGHGFDKSVDYVADVKDHTQAARQTFSLNDWDLDSIKQLLGNRKGEGKLRLLEIGCGTGVFLDKARQHGFDVEGLELSAYAADFVRKMGIPVRTESIESANDAPNTWDVIVMREVIEHLPHPKKSLETVYSWLKPGGVLFMATGNYDCPERKLKGADWFYFMPEGHLYYFSNRTMTNYLKKVGFGKVMVTNQGDMLMDKLRNAGVIAPSTPDAPWPGAPRNLLKRLVFLAVRGVNHFISSGMRIYAVK
jgi:2-polyprenyl-3-methyl-5-hydroxy-6-metoxy-1,4-benzoquinol methylase